HGGRLCLLHADRRGLRLPAGAQCRPARPGRIPGQRMNTPSSMPRPVLWCLLAVPLALAGCGLTRTSYERPAVQRPAAWTYAAARDAAAAGGVWWRNFDDPTLTRLIDLALERNNDLAAAALRVRQAQLRAGLARSDQFPTL